MSFRSPFFAPMGFPALIFGVLIPIFALGIELLTGAGAEIVFDPIPTWGHVALIAAVPAINLWVGRLGEEASLKSARRGIFLAGTSCAIALSYTIIFVPLMPFAAVGILFFGLGLLPFSPLFGLIVSARLARAWMQVVQGSTHVLLFGLLAGLVITLAVDLRASATGLALHWTKGTTAEQESAVDLMRAVGDTELVAKTSGGRVPGLFVNIHAALNGSEPFENRPLDEDTARRLHFRATGDDLPLIDAGSSTFWDRHQGGTQVGQRVSGLRLVTSRMEGEIFTAENLAYFEWTFEVANEGNSSSEARLLLGLPEGAVGSRATLWVHDVLREASIAGKGEARAAYESIVRRQRDPLLVSSAGAQRLLVQAFPVLPRERMKFRVGISAPLQEDQGRRAQVVLPAILSHNFVIEDDVPHNVRISGDWPLAASLTSLFGERRGDKYFLSGDLSDAALLGTRPYILGRRTALVSGPIEPRSVHILLDGSRQNRDTARALSDVLEDLPESHHIGLTIAAHDAPPTVQPALLTKAHRERLLRTIEQARFVGGENNLPGLAKAVQSEADIALWLHGPQPVSFSSSRRQLWMALADGGDDPELVRYQATPGPAFSLAGKRWFATSREVLPTGDRNADLKRIFSRLAAAGEGGRTAEIPAEDGRARRIGEQVAAARILAAAAESEGMGRTDAIALAARRNLISSVSSGVVLERDIEYDEHGLPKPPDEVYQVPAPAALGIFLFGLTMLAGMRWRRRLYSGGAAATGGSA